MKLALNTNDEILLQSGDIVYIPELNIGDTWVGGTIFYMWSGNTHGYVAVSSPLSIGQYMWGCSNTVISGALGTGIGTGRQNTIDIVNNCADTNTAAKHISGLTINGYSDWWLPSKDELNQLLTNLSFSFQAPIWSSTQSPDLYYDPSGYYWTAQSWAFEYGYGVGLNLEKRLQGNTGGHIQYYWVIPIRQF